MAFSVTCNIIIIGIRDKLTCTTKCYFIIHFYWSSDNSILSFKFIAVILEVFSISEKYSQLLQIAAQSNIKKTLISGFLLLLLFV